MFKTLIKLVRIAYGDNLPPVERWALKHANKASPDEIIVAAVIQSFGKNPDSWKDSSITKTLTAVDAKSISRENDSRKDVECLSLYNGVIRIEMSIPYVKSRDDDGMAPWIVVGSNNVIVDDLELDELNSKRILQAWNNLKTARERAEAAAAKALADMERNEKAWNLAERLLGMKRNEHGALVPVNPVEQEAQPEKRHLRFGGYCDDANCILEEECLCGREEAA